MRFSEEQFSDFSPGETVEHIWCSVVGRTNDGNLIFEDIMGGQMKTTLKDEGYPVGAHVILTGKIGQNRGLIIEKIQVFQYIRIKFAVSILAVMILFWKLLREIKLTSKGLFISPFKH